MVILPKLKVEETAALIEKFIVKKVEKMRKTGVVIGLSGGIDSSVTAVLCKRALEKTTHDVYGFILPGGDSDDNRADNSDAIALGKSYDIQTFINVIPIQFMAKYFGYIKSNKSKVFEQIQFTDFQIGNLASRLRANALSTYADYFNCLVCGTGNKDEDYGIGYYTLFGDGAVHMSPIGGLSKRHVYEMAKFLKIDENVPNIYMKTPSARLEEGQTDYKDLGYGYNIVEIVMEGLKQNKKSGEIVDSIKDLSYDKTKFEDIWAVFINILDRHTMAISKAQLISPDIAPVALEY